MLRTILLAWVALPAMAADFAPVLPGVPIVFPRDYGAHPAFRTEWWYVTGWLTLPGGKPAGFQVTFFRSRTGIAPENPSRFAPRQLLFAHAALSDPALGRIRQDQRAARTGFGLAEAAEDDTRLHIDDWSLQRRGDGYRATIPAAGFRLDLTLTPTQAVLLQGDRGFSRKGRKAAQASYYYSQPQLKVAGNVTASGKAVAVTGTAWLDHEWSSELLDEAAVGWDWAGIDLDDGGALMAFRLRDANGNSLWAGGSRRTADGSLRVLMPNELRFSPRRYWTSPRSQVRYPVEMEVAVDGGKADTWLLKPLLDDQELDTRASTGGIYWEGAVTAEHNGRPAGRGYLELTGYWKRMKF